MHRCDVCTFQKKHNVPINKVNCFLCKQHFEGVPLKQLRGNFFHVTCLFLSNYSTILISYDQSYSNTGHYSYRGISHGPRQRPQWPAVRSRNAVSVSKIKAKKRNVFEMIVRIIFISYVPTSMVSKWALLLTWHHSTRTT